uniref:Fucosyltransferase n=1 Tax=Salmo trutta TaxID=8032 RepID=A0A674DM27_SALTR
MMCLGPNCRIGHRSLMGILLLGCLLTCLLYRPAITWLPVLAKHFQAEHKQDVTVLVWHWPFDHPFKLNSCRSLYNIEGCHLTADRELYSQADAVLIHHREIEEDLSNLPQEPRPSFQKWVWMNFESPAHTNRIPGLEDLFNVTLNYRQDADINMPYGSLVPRTEEREEFVPHKNRLVCWIVSNWNPEHKRTWYYMELRKFIRIHTYGDPFNKKVSLSEYRMIVASCKFYLSFENSVHKDYITEKLYNALKLGAVPVVMGPTRGNYEKFIPGDSFIHVDDFRSPRALAKHLLFLDENEEMYRKYFKWQRIHTVRINSFPIQNACNSYSVRDSTAISPAVSKPRDWESDKG